MTHDHEHGNKDRHQLDHHFVLDEARADGGTKGPVIREDPDEVYKQVETFAKHGRGSKTDLPRLVESLTDEYKMKVQDLLPDLAKRLGGDKILEIGEQCRERLDFRIQHALEAKPPVSGDHLRKYMRSMDAASFAWLGDNEPILDKVRKVLPGDFATELPQLGRFPDPLHGKPLLVKWYLAKTDKTLVALNFSTMASAELAHSLDTLDEWGWLDDLHVGHGYAFGTGLEALRDATGNKTVKAKLEKMLGSFDSSKVTPAYGDAGKKDLHEALDSNASTSTLLDAAARASTVNDQDPDKLKKRLASESSSVALELMFATDAPLDQAIPVLASSAGATPAQMFGLLLQKTPEERANALTNSTLRKHVWSSVGSDVPLSRFFPDLEARESAHAIVYKDEALREWGYKEKSPLTNLWLAAGSAHAKEACKLVRRGLGSLEFAKQLPTTAPAVEVRRFILNCGDDKLGAYVREHVLGDHEAKIDPSWDQVEESAPEIYGVSGARGDKARLQVAELGKDVPEEKVETTILDRLADMTAADRTAMLSDELEIKRLFATLSGESVTRAVYLLSPTIAQLLKLPLANEAGLLDYLRTRSAKEEQDALARSSLVKPARALFLGISPLLVYATLDDPNVMAKALETNADLLEWLLEDTEPSLALSCLARDQVRRVAAPLFEQRAHMWDRLPQYQHLLPAGKRGFDALAKAAEDEDSRREAEMYRDGGGQRDSADAVIDKNAERMVKASGETHLWDAIEVLAKNRGNEKSALALVNNASAKERLALLDGTHTASVEALRSMVVVSPHHVFPSLTTAQLLSFPDGASWLLDTEPSFVILGRVAKAPKAIAQFVSVLEANHGVATKWVTALPEGPSLTLEERHALDAMCEHVKDETVLRLLFRARFATTIDATFGAQETKRVWKVVARLPPSQVNQQTIGSFSHGTLGGEIAGLWDHENVVLNEDRTKLEGTDQSYNDAPLLTVDEVKKYFGLSDAELAKASAKDGWIVQENGKYRVKPIDIEEFCSTVLHEVGHSVDSLLGEHTDVIFGMGGWKRYGVDQFEDWAKEMGALDGITGDDRKDIISAWKDSIRSGKPVNEMVDAKHPALATRYSSDPLVQTATRGNRFYYKEAPRPAFNGRVFTTNGVVLGSVPKQTADVAPSQYAMSAPAEYFAECYVEYYRAYKGTPESEKDKGGHLASWIKEWFDKHVDKVRFSPQRLHGNAKKDNGSSG